jgi:O-antigen/teichoic acid export membrane protein
MTTRPKRISRALKRIRTAVSKVKPRGAFLRGVLTLASGSAVSQALIVIASPLLTRLYTPDDFGVLAVFSALLGLTSVVSCLRYELAIPVAKSSRAALSVIVIALTFNAFIALIMATALVPLSLDFAELLSTPALAAYLWLLPIGVVFVGIYRTLTFWAVRERSFGPLARTKLTQSIGGIATQIACGISIPGPLGLILGQVVGQSAGAVSLSRSLLRQAVALRYRLRGRRLIAAVRRHIRFPKYDLPAASLNTLSANLPQFMLAALFNPAVAGFYLLAYRVISMPVAILGQAVGQGLYAHSREAITTGTLDRYVFQVVAILAVLMLLPLLVLLAFGEDLFAAVFGSEWRTAGTYASWLILGASAQFIYSPISLMLQATNAQHINLALQILMLTARLTALSIGLSVSDALSAIIALSIADLICYIFGIYLTLRQIRRYMKSHDGSYKDP